MTSQLETLTIARKGKEWVATRSRNDGTGERMKTAELAEAVAYLLAHPCDEVGQARKQLGKILEEGEK